MRPENYVGNTPLVQIKHIASSRGARVFTKLETHNLAGSVKARPALQMLIDCESAGILIPSIQQTQTIIAATGGNLGSALACLALSRGYRVILVIPDNFSPVKIKRCESYGAKVVLSDHKQGRASHVHRTAELVAANPAYVNFDQFSSAANPRSHFNTGREILDALENVTVFTAAVGSGGTISGIGQRLKETNCRTRVVAVQPQGCDILNGKTIDHIIEGTTLGFVPKTFAVELVDDLIEVTKEEVLQTFRRLPREEGIFLGLSSAANICAAVKIASKLPKDCVVCTVAPDSGRNYVS